MFQGWAVADGTEELGNRVGVEWPVKEVEGAAGLAQDSLPHPEPALDKNRNKGT